MTKKLLTAIILGLLCLLTACSGGTTPSDPSPKSEKSGQSSQTGTLDKISESEIARKAEDYYLIINRDMKATYTNKNNYSDDVVVPNAKFSNVKILSKEPDGDKFVYECTADFSNADWIGTAHFKISFKYLTPPSSNLAVDSIEYSEAIAEPSYPLDFSDENIYLLFENDSFRYKANPSDDRMTLADINKNTLLSVKMLEFIPDDPDNMDEHYKVELRLTDGLVLRGTVFADYLPRISEEEGERQGIEKWGLWYLSLDDFVQMK